jgi:hypothetical protein
VTYSLQKLPSAFILDHARFISWECLKVAFDRGWLTVTTVAAIADSRVTSQLDERELLIAFELSTIAPTKWHNTEHFLKELCVLEKRDGGCQQKCTKLWLLLGLLWLYENSGEFADPLAFAEELVEDLDRPGDAVGWLRFMPADFTVWDPRKHSESENYARLMENWKQYLRREGPAYLKNTGHILPG